MKSSTRKQLYAVCAIITILSFFLLLYFPIQPKGNILDEGWVIQNPDGETPIHFPYQQPVEGLETVVFTKTFSYTSGDALVLTWLKGQAAIVLLNGQMIFSMGNAAEPTANIWNSVFLVHLPEPINDQNVLEIHLTSASYPLNISIPPYIMSLEKAEKRVGLVDFLYNDVLLISIGSSLLIGIILIVLSMLLKKGWSPEVFLGLASILGAVECFDYIFRISTGSLAAFLIVKKILMIAGYLSALSFVAGTEKYYHGNLKISRYLAVPTLLSILMFAVARDLVGLTNMLGLLNIVLFIDLGIAVVLITKGGRGKDWLLIPAIWLVLSLMQMILIEVFELPWPYIMQQIILLSTVIFGFNLLVDFNRIYSEKLDLEKRIDLDSLTTAYNRNILSKTTPNQYDVLILMDLDNFKSYNDKYGHQSGDKLLIQFADIIKGNLRPHDVVVRYGGDEFLVLLSEIGIIDAEQVALRIRLQFEQLTKKDKLSVSYGIERIEQSLDSDFNKADRLMYAMKQAKYLQNKVKRKEQEKDEGH